MLNFASLVPHPPLLIESIGQDQTNKVSGTAKALARLEQDLYVSMPQAIIVISSHAGIFDDAFTLNYCEKYVSDFSSFGDFSTIDEYEGASSLCARIYDNSTKHNLPINVISDEKLDHGTAVPLHFLMRNLKKIPIIIIGYSKLDNKTHVKLGELLREVIENELGRVTLIASGDLSHRLHTDSPAGYHTDGEVFDKDIIEKLENHNATGIIGMDPNLVENAGQCAYRSILILLGALKNTNYTFKNYSYESPFGVGYLTGNFIFP